MPVFNDMQCTCIPTQTISCIHVVLGEMHVEKSFTYTFGSRGVSSTLTVPVTIPLEQTVEDFVGRLIKAHNIPCFVEDGKLDKNKIKFMDRHNEFLGRVIRCLRVS